MIEIISEFEYSEVCRRSVRLDRITIGSLGFSLTGDFGANPGYILEI
jgi:hypothetical protein